MIGTALTWGVALAALAAGSLAIGLASGLVPKDIFGAGEVASVALRGLLAGGVAGALYAWALSARERGHTLATLKPRRVALWGFLAAGCLPAVLSLAAGGPALPLGVLVAGSVGYGLIGSLLSTTTLRIARRADEQARLARGTDAGHLLP